MKNIVSDQPCPSCREMGRDSTGNHLMVFADGNKHCNRCGYSEIKETGDANQMDDNLRSHEAGTGTPAVVEKFNPTPSSHILSKKSLTESCHGRPANTLEYDQPSRKKTGVLSKIF